jgi:hypothetical protein
LTHRAFSVIGRVLPHLWARARQEQAVLPIREVGHRGEPSSKELLTCNLQVTRALARNTGRDGDTQYLIGGEFLLRSQRLDDLQSRDPAVARVSS